MRPLLGYERTHIRYKIGCTYSGHLLSQHLSTWDEWSSPSELIHPGDGAEYFELREQPIGFRNGIRAIGHQRQIDRFGYLECVRVNDEGCCPRDNDC
jgi:hypothetical protein